MTGAAVALPDVVSARPLAPWLQVQLEGLLRQRGHAWLLQGPSGLGQFELALALATSWLCDKPTPQGACGHCSSCHAVAVHTHADMFALLPETLSLSLGWPLDEKTQSDLDSKKRKPSKEIKVDAARETVSFTQLSRSRGDTKVVLVFPAERMNHITANTLLKTLEEPPGAVKFILASEAAHQLLPTIRSRCLGHTMVWPDFDLALAWLGAQYEGAQHSAVAAKKPAKSSPALSLAELRVVFQAVGARPADALRWMQDVSPQEAARQWRALPSAMARGDASALAAFSPALALDALQKLCHDLLASHCGAAPRFFNVQDLPRLKDTTKSNAFFILTQWAKELSTAVKTAEHPYNAGLMFEALASRASQVLQAA